MKLFIITALVCELTSCTKTEETQVVAAITPVGACIADIALAVNGVEDPAAIATTCGVAVTDVAQVVSELLASQPTTVPSGDAGTTSVAPAVQAHLSRIFVRANNLMLAGHDAGK